VQAPHGGLAEPGRAARDEGPGSENQHARRASERA
jgi:hypothetical protein